MKVESYKLVVRKYIELIIPTFKSRICIIHLYTAPFKLKMKKKTLDKFDHHIYLDNHSPYGAR